MKLFQQIQTIAAKIKATGNLAILKNDEEYVVLVSKHLSKEVMWRWWEQDKSGWTNFYIFLETSTKTAKKQLTSESIMSSFSREMEDKPKCSSCNKSHRGKCNKPKIAAALQGREKICPVCNKSAHKYKTKTEAEGIFKLIKGCLGFKAAADDQKQEMIKKLK